METFEALLAPHDEAIFLRDVMGRSALHIKGESDRFGRVLSWEELSEFLSFGGTALSRVQLTKGRDVVPEEAYRRTGMSGSSVLRMGEFGAILRQGATLNIDAVHDVFGAVRRLCRVVEDRIETSVAASVHATWGGADTYLSGWNDHDVIMLQMSGESRWRTHRPSQAFVAAGIMTGEPPVDGVGWQEVIMREGHLLYVPKGWWYFQHSVDQAEFILRLSFRNTTGLDILSRIVDRLSLNEFMRMDCPRFADLAILSQYFTRMQQEMVSACTEPGIFLDFFKDIRAMFDPKQVGGLPWGVSCNRLSIKEDLLIVSRIRFSESVVVFPDGDAVEVFFDSKRTVLDGFTGGILKQIVGSSVREVRELLKGFDGDEKRVKVLHAISELVTAGFIGLQEPITLRGNMRPTNGRCGTPQADATSYDSQ